MKISEGKWNAVLRDVYRNFGDPDIKSVSSGMTIPPSDISQFGTAIYARYLTDELRWKDLTTRDGDIEFHRRVVEEEWKLQQEINIGLLQEALDL